MTRILRDQLQTAAQRDASSDVSLLATMWRTSEGSMTNVREQLRDHAARLNASSSPIQYATWFQLALFWSTISKPLISKD